MVLCVILIPLLKLMQKNQQEELGIIKLKPVNKYIDNNKWKIHLPTKNW